MPVLSLLSFDPGVPFGYSWWPRGLLPTAPPKLCGVFDFDVKTRGMMAWLQKSGQAAAEVEHLMDLYRPDTVASEFPHYRADPTGQATAESGSLGKLFINFGRIVEICRIRKTRFIPVRVIDWMGQLDDPKIKLFVERRIGALDGLLEGIPRGQRTHAIDAIGMGIYVRTGRL